MECFPQKHNFFWSWKNKDMNILDDMGWRNYEESVIMEVNYSKSVKLSSWRANPYYTHLIQPIRSFWLIWELDGFVCWSRAGTKAAAFQEIDTPELIF